MHTRVELHDPVMNDLKCLVEAVRKAVHIVSVEAIAQASASKSVRYDQLRFETRQNLTALEVLLGECVEGLDEGASLGFLMKIFPEISELFGATQLELETMVEEFLGEAKPELKAQVVEEPAALFDALKTKLSFVTPGHVALQAHLEHVVVNGPTSMDIGQENRVALYEPITTIRDKYFANPRSELLSTYLAAAEQVLRSSDYRLYGPAHKGGAGWASSRNRKLESLVTELEIQALLSIVAV